MILLYIFTPKLDNYKYFILCFSRLNNLKIAIAYRIFPISPH